MRLEGKSCYIFGEDNPVRKVCSSISHNFWFDMFIIFLIFASTVTLAFEHPLEDP